MKNVLIHMRKKASLRLHSYILEVNCAYPFSLLKEREFRLPQSRGRKLCSSAAVISEQIVPASKQNLSSELLAVLKRI